MKDVRFSDNEANIDIYIPNSEQTDYDEPFAIKQHASRLKKLTWNELDEGNQSENTTSTYYSNLKILDDVSNEDTHPIDDVEIDVDDLIAQQKELLELQNNVQKSLQIIQNKLSESNIKSKWK